MRSALGILIAILCLQHGAKAQTQFPEFSSEFHRPFRMTSVSGVVDSGSRFGHCGPAMVDWNDDGLLDMVVGDFSGHFYLFRNIGETGKPVFAQPEKLMTYEFAAHVDIGCCKGSQPRFHDLNGDGHLDLLANSYDPGYCFWFKGMRNGKLAPPVMLKDREGNPISSRGRMPDDPTNGSELMTELGSFFDLVDWDSDGDLDLLIGCFDGQLKLRMNEGSADTPSFATTSQYVSAAGTLIKVKAHNCPVAADWDGDSLFDLVIGSDDGSVLLFRNVGSKGQPRFARGEQLLAKHEGIGYQVHIWDDSDVRPGIRSQVEIADYNQDGKPDLLVGDFWTAFEFRRNLSPAERNEALEILSANGKASKKYSRRFRELQEEFAKKYPGKSRLQEEAIQEWVATYQRFLAGPEASELREEQAATVDKLQNYLQRWNASVEPNRKPSTINELATDHGHVWIFLRR